MKQCMSVEKEMGEQFNPWPPIESFLFDYVDDADEILTILETAAFYPKPALTNEELHSHKTRKRAYRQRVNRYYLGLASDKARVQFATTIVSELCRRYPNYQEDLNKVLRRIGWSFQEGHLIPLELLDPGELTGVPPEARSDLLKAAERFSHDPSGAVTSACAAIDSITGTLVPDAKLLNFQQKVNRAFEKLKVYDFLQSELIGIGWEEKDAKKFCKNLKGAVSQTAYVLQTLRREMGDVHGSKPALPRLAIFAVKWATILASLLHWKISEANGEESGFGQNG